MYNIEFYENSAGYSEIREFFDLLLHHYRKKSRKTPAQEITRAKAERKDYLSRGMKNELE